MEQDMDLPLIILSSLWALAAAGFTWHCVTVARQITYVTLADGRRQTRKLPMMFRLLLPLAPNFRDLFNRSAWTQIKEKINKQIITAGFEGLISKDEILSLHMLFPCVIGSLWVLLIILSVNTDAGRIMEPMLIPLCILGPVLLALYPAIWLKQAILLRHKSIRRSLPFVMDLLTLSVEAGLDFMSALQQNIGRRTIDPLAEELIRVIREIQLGKTRREALRDMSQRVNMQDLRSVIGALVQADELGVGIGSILRIQSTQIRQRRFEYAEKSANKAPIKMLFPLLFFIFPAVLIILMAPVFMQMMQYVL